MPNWDSYEGFEIQDIQILERKDTTALVLGMFSKEFDQSSRYSLLFPKYIYQSFINFFIKREIDIRVLCLNLATNQIHDYLWPHDSSTQDEVYTMEHDAVDIDSHNVHLQNIAERCIRFFKKLYTITNDTATAVDFEELETDAIVEAAAEVDDNTAVLDKTLQKLFSIQEVMIHHSQANAENINEEGLHNYITFNEASTPIILLRKSKTSLLGFPKLQISQVLIISLIALLILQLVGSIMLLTMSNNNVIVWSSGFFSLFETSLEALLAYRQFDETNIEVLKILAIQLNFKKEENVLTRVKVSRILVSCKITSILITGLLISGCFICQHFHSCDDHHEK